MTFGAVRGPLPPPHMHGNTKMTEETLEPNGTRTPIGNDVEAEFWVSERHNLRAINLWHKGTDGRECVCCVYLKVPDTWQPPHRPQVWQVVQPKPLTLAPSVVCTRCGLHGFITNGKWVPC